MRILFAGTPAFAASHLACLANSSQHDLVAVFTQPDRPAGRGKKLTPSPVKELARQLGLPVHQPDTLKQPTIEETIKSLNADIMVVVAYGLILPANILSLPRYGCINVHASLLPRWRGAAPIQRAIEAGDRETGITIMQMDEGLDTGGMLLKARCSIEENDNSSSLHDKLQTLGGPLLLEALEQIESGRLSAETQDATQACYAEKITKEEARLNWSLTARELVNKVRAFNPFPICFFEHDQKTIRVWEAALLNEQTKQAPGTILSCNDSGIIVSTTEGSLRLELLQLPGKRKMFVKDIINGNNDLFSVGTKLC